MTAPIRLFLVLLLLLPGAQAPLSAQRCDCLQQFEWMRAKVAANYAGYGDKVTDLTRPGLDSLSARLSSQAAQAPDTTCLRLLRDWLHFFRDGHLQIGQSAGGGPAISADSIRARYAQERSIPMTQQRAKQLLDIRGEKATPIEGIWVNAEGNYRVALLASPIGASTAAGYTGIVLRADSLWWMPGQIKFSLSLLKGDQYEAEYFMRDHTPRQTAAYTDGNVLTFKGLGLWRKVYPEAVPDAALLEFRSPFDAPGGRPGAGFALQRLSPSTLLLRIPTFDHTQRHHLDSLLAAHTDWLSSTPNLLIDLRGNGGGSDISYQHLLPLIYTRP
ncbi:MAG TPA: S41 family peptidase, partial [Saprospiraceae bacterium]|nr:S41 family peptidase [Saprospiraceae bacterium]